MSFAFCYRMLVPTIPALCFFVCAQYAHHKHDGMTVNPNPAGGLLSNFRFPLDRRMFRLPRVLEPILTLHFPFVACQ